MPEHWDFVFLSPSYCFTKIAHMFRGMDDIINIKGDESDKFLHIMRLLNKYLDDIKICNACVIHFLFMGKKFLLQYVEAISYYISDN